MFFTLNYVVGSYHSNSPHKHKILRINLVKLKGAYCINLVILKIGLTSEYVSIDLELVVNIHIEAGKDLLFFDEIQSCPSALMGTEDMPDLHVITASSSIPIGGT